MLSRCVKVKGYILARDAGDDLNICPALDDFLADALEAPAVLALFPWGVSTRSMSMVRRAISASYLRCKGCR
ncbi:MAG: hypothetical protein LBU32_20195 [Clostridiales bacterium]|nr:hypothetical protein [Clostridiales bacterium]